MQEQMSRHIKELMIERLNLRTTVDQIADNVPIFSTDDGGLGLDSIDALDLAVALFEEFQVEVAQKDMHIFKNVNSISSFVLERTAQEALVTL